MPYLRPGVCLTPEIKPEYDSSLSILRKCDDIEDVVVFLREYMRQVFVDWNTPPEAIHRLRAIAEDTLNKICKDSEIHGIEIDNVKIENHELTITLATGPYARTDIYIPAVEWLTLKPRMTYCAGIPGNLTRSDAPWKTK